MQLKLNFGLSVCILFFLFSCQDDPELPLFYLKGECKTICATKKLQPGDEVEIDGLMYKVVNEAMLREMISNHEDVTKVITTYVENMSNLIKDDFHQDISRWDVSNVTDMSRMFGFYFNQNISCWDVSSVVDMSYMFANAINFDQPIGNWDVSNVTNMTGMFMIEWEYICPSFGPCSLISLFNQDISTWDVSNVTNMNWMFSGTTLFNQNLSNWDVKQVTSCSGFSNSTPSWVLPQPEFMNCNPG